MPDSSPSQKIVRDLRLDRIVTWALTVAVGIGVMVAGFTYKEMMKELRTLSGVVVTLNTNVELLKEQIKDIDEIEDEVESLRERVHDLELWKASMGGNP